MKAWQLLGWLVAALVSALLYIHTDSPWFLGLSVTSLAITAVCAISIYRDRVEVS